MSIGGENKANAEEEKEQRDKEKQGTLKLSEALIQLCLEPTLDLPVTFYIFLKLI